MRVDPPLINEAVGTLQTVFGDVWLAEACKPDRGLSIPFRRHPIGNLLAPPGSNQVAAILELVEYIKHAAPSSAFGMLVDGLKHQYGPTFLQLAFGYRLVRTGATTLVFEPPVQGGLRGDLGCDIAGRPIIAECFIPRVANPTAEAHWLLTQCMNLRDGLRDAVISIAIKLKTMPASEQRKTLVRLVREACEKVDANVVAGRGEVAFYIETDAAHISVGQTIPAGPREFSKGRQHPNFPDNLGQPFIFARVGVVPEADLKKEAVVGGGYETRDHVAIWLSDEDMEKQSLNKDLDASLDNLGTKLERKLPQTKVDERTGRLLIVNSWITGQLHRASENSLSRLRDRLFRKHVGVAGLLMVAHNYQPQVMRHNYDIEPLLPAGPQALPEGFVQEMSRLEADQRIPAQRL